MIAPEFAPWVSGFISLFFILGVAELGVAFLRAGSKAGAGEDPL